MGLERSFYCNLGAFFLFKIFSGGPVAFRINSKLITSVSDCGPRPPVWPHVSGFPFMVTSSVLSKFRFIFSSPWAFSNANYYVLKVVSPHSSPGLFSFLLEIDSLPQGGLP